MKGRSRYFGLLASLGAAFLVAGAAAPAAAQQAKLYELVENLDTVALGTGHRISSWTAQGSAEAGSPFCPAAALPKSVKSCTITAFGTDDIDLSTFTGNVWANIVAVANDPRIDNVVDAPEVSTFSGQIIGDITIFLPDGGMVQPDLGKQRSLLGPAIPLIYVRNGQFFKDDVPTVRESKPSMLPSGTPAARFDSTFRLPFAVANGKHQRTERGKVAYYLGDDGSLIKVDNRDESALGFPLLRADVFFKN
jgi:hypothetical protein